MGARIHGHEQGRNQQRGDGEACQQARVGGLQRTGCDVACVHALDFTAGGGDGVAGAGGIANGLLKPREIHRLPDDVLHLPAGLPEQTPGARQ